MNKMKKLGITLLTVAMCVLLSITVLAITFISVDITATADKNVYCVTGFEQLATVTIKADRQIEIFSLDATVIFPEGWTLVSIVNDEIGLSQDDLNKDGKIMWFTSTNNANTTNLLEITVKIPADVTVGEYEVGIKDLELTKFMDKKFDNYYAQSLTVTATITVKEHDYDTTYNFAADGKTCTAKRVCGNDASHVETATAKITSEITTPATCEGMGMTTYTATFDKAWAATQKKTVEDVESIGHDWGETTYNFAADGKTCTAERVCKNDATHVETATATISSEITTPATCEGMGKTTYTATFDKGWAAKQTKTVEDVESIGHDWGEASYKDNGDGTHTATYTCKNYKTHTKSDDPAEHVYADGECVCGAIEPIKGLKGDVNLDGSVDAKDATALARHLARLDILTDETALYNADTNSDGVVDAKDATKLARYLARLIDSFDEE